MNFSSVNKNIFIIIIASLLFIPFLGAVHLFDWDEINFAECAREMIVSKNYSTVQINFQPFWEKPPLFIWMQAVCMSFFGINEFAARFPNAICGIITLLVLFNIGKKLFDEKFALIWVLAFAGSLLPHFYFKSGIIDPWFNLFIFVGIHRFILFSNDTEKNKNLILSAIFISLAMLTKGPVAFLIFVLCVATFYILKRFKDFPSVKNILLYLLIIVLVGGLWFASLIISGKSNVIVEFILYQIRLFTTEDATHGGPFYYHFIILLIGCFPASVFAIAGMRKKQETPFRELYKKWMMILFWVVLILFSVVQTKIVHYSSLCWFPLTFLAAYCVYKIMNYEMGWKKWMTFFLTGIAILLGTVFTSLQFIDKYKTEIINSGIIKDSFAIENLKADVHWSGYEFLIGVFFLIGILVTLYFIVMKKNTNFIPLLFIITLVTTNLAALIFAPKIEQYTQGAAIEFYEKFRGKEFNVTAYGFKTYADFFYSNNIPLINHPVPSDKLYYVCKIQDVEKINKEWDVLKELYRKNGFVFWERERK